MILRTNREFAFIRMVAILQLLCGIICCSFSVSAFAPAPFVQQQHSALFGVAKSGGKLIRTEQEFDDLVLGQRNPKPVMVFFTAPWCGPCRLSIPVVKEVLQQFKAQIDVVEVCTDDFPEVASNSGVVSIPTIQLYYRGKMKDTIVGCVAANVLASSVEKALEDVGMEKTRPDVDS